MPAPVSIVVPKHNTAAISTNHSRHPPAPNKNRPILCNRDGFVGLDKWRGRLSMDEMCSQGSIICMIPACAVCLNQIFLLWCKQFRL